MDRGSNVKLAQLFGIVDCGLILVKHIFHGLKRPLCDGEDMNADKLKLVFCWKPAFDYCWHESGRFDDAKLESREAPAERVFAVIVSPNQNRAKYPTVDFWIERWFWLRESKTLASAPTEWENRYDGELKIKR